MEWENVQIKNPAPTAAKESDGWTGVQIKTTPTAPEPVVTTSPPIVTTTPKGPGATDTMDWAGRPKWDWTKSGSAPMRQEQYERDRAAAGFGATPDKVLTEAATNPFNEVNRMRQQAADVVTGKVKPTPQVTLAKPVGPPSIALPDDASGPTTVDPPQYNVPDELTRPSIGTPKPSTPDDPSATTWQLPRLPANVLSVLSGAIAGGLGDSQLSRYMRANAVRADGNLVPPLTPNPKVEARAAEIEKGAENLPLVFGDDNDRFLKPGLENEALRKERALTDDGFWMNIGQTLRNTTQDIGDNVAGLAELLNQVGGITSNDPSDPRTHGEKMADLGGALSTGAVGATGDIVSSWLDGNANSLVTQPVTSFLTLVPILSAAKTVPGARPLIAKIGKGIDALGTTASEAAAARLAKSPAFVQRVAELTGKGASGVWNAGEIAQQAAARWLAEGIRQLDPRATALVESLLHGGEITEGVIDTASDIMQRQARRNGVSLVSQELEPRALIVDVPRKAAVEASGEPRRVGGSGPDPVTQPIPAPPPEPVQPSTVAKRTRAPVDPAVASLRTELVNGRHASKRNVAKWIEEQLAEIRPDESGEPLDIQFLRDGLQKDLPEGVAPLSDAAVQTLYDMALERGRFSREVVVPPPPPPPPPPESPLARPLAPEPPRPPPLQGDLRLAARAGNVYLPKGDDAGPIIASGIEGLRERFPGAPEEVLTDIASTSERVVDLGEQAVRAGFDTNAPTAPKHARYGATQYDAARRIAEHFKDQAKGKGTSYGETAMLTEAMRQIGVPDAVAQNVAEWMRAEVELRDHAKRLEPSQSQARRRPVSVVTRFEVGENGELLAKMDAHRNAPTGADLPEVGVVRDTEHALREMADIIADEEAPRSFLTDNPIVNDAVRTIAREVRNTAYDAEAPGTLMGENAPSIADMTPETVKRFEAAQTKRMLPETIMQRLLDPLDADSAELLSVREVRNRAIDTLKQRAIDDGMAPSQARNLAAGFAREVVDQGKTGIAKNRFIEITNPATGNVLWGRSDYAKLFHALPEKVQRRAVAQRMGEVARDLKNATVMYGQLQAIMAEVNRLRLTPDGKPIPVTAEDAAGATDPGAAMLTDPDQARLGVEAGQPRLTREPGADLATRSSLAERAPMDLDRPMPGAPELTPGAKRAPTHMGFGSVDTYAQLLLDRVIKKGELEPQMMPYSGREVRSALNALAEKNPEQAVQLRALGEQLKGYAAADGYHTAGFKLAKVWNEAWREQFKGTDNAPTFANVYVKPSVASSLQAHLYMLHGAQQAFPLLSALLSRAKAGVVAERLSALFNNNLSNLGSDIMTEVNPLATSRDLWTESIKLKQFLDGDTTNLTAAERQKFQALSEVNIKGTSNLSRDIGESNFWKSLPTDITRPIEGASAKFGGRPGNVVKPLLDFQDFHREMYSTLGDTPFRIGKASRVYDGLTQRIGLMEAGSTIDVPVGSAKFVRVTKLADGRVQLSEMAGGRAKAPASAVDRGVVAADGPEMARIKALAGKVEQAKFYGDYGRAGNFAKYLRGGPLSLVSGIFSWYFFAMDIPGVKKGLVGRVLDGPTQYKTTSNAVATMQNGERALMQARRAALTASAREAIADQRQLDELRESFAWNPSTEGIILAKSTNPWYVRKRDVTPLIWSGPTQTVLSGAERIAQWQAFDNILDDPEALADMLAKTDPSTIAALPPDERARVLARRKYLEDYLLDRRFNTDSLVSLAGMGGGPLLSVAMRLKDGRLDGTGAIAEFSKMMFGATLFSAANVAMGAIGEYAPEPVADVARGLSTRGSDEVRHGFRSGESAADNAGLGEWWLRQILGVGWTDQPLFGEDAGVETAGGEDFKAQGEKRISRVRSELRRGIMSAAEKERNAARQALNRAKTPEEKAAAAEALNKITATAEDLVDDINAWADWYAEDLETQYNLLEGKK